MPYNSNKEWIDDNNLKIDNIKTLANMLPNHLNTQDATATVNDIIDNKSAYVNGIKIVGNIPNNGTLNYIPSNTIQNIPAGYTVGGTVAAIDFTNIGTISPTEYNECENLALNILGGANNE